MGVMKTMKLAQLRRELQKAEIEGNAAKAAEIRRKIEELQAKSESGKKDPVSVATGPVGPTEGGKTLLT